MPSKDRKPKQPRRKFRLSPAEKDIIAEVVQKSETPITTEQVKGLALTLNRRKETIKKAIEAAREDFAESAGEYVRAHKEVVTRGLEDGSVKGLEQARLGAEWAMENMSLEGSRVIDKPTKEGSGVQVFVGVKIGGMKDPETPVEVVTGEKA